MARALRTTGVARRRMLGTGLGLGAGLGVGALLGPAACSAPARTRKATAPGHTSAPPPHGAPAAAASANAGPAAEVSHGPRTREQVALTFHGQGAPSLLEALLGTAERAGARVTILAVGSWLAAEPALARRILRGGHDLGNHTQHHLALASMAAAGVRQEIDECAQVLRRLTGGIGAWFRPSQTPTSTPVIRAQAGAVGYQTCLAYDVDSLDYTDPGPAAIVATVMRSVRPGSIVSLHCGHAGTVAALPGLLAGLADRGLRPVTATTLLAA
jgi:peptidoglycan/xylan/chitin deacetylase (PgdA/CDA1 family)